MENESRCSSLQALSAARTGAGGSGTPPVKQADGVPSRDDGDAKSSGLPPYDLRHAFASLQIRAGLSIPEIAEQKGHSPQMTITTYAHVIRELKGLRALSAEGQIEAGA